MSNITQLLGHCDVSVSIRESPYSGNLDVSVFMEVNIPDKVRKQETTYFCQRKHVMGSNNPIEEAGRVTVALSDLFGRLTKDLNHIGKTEG